jgi:aminopeptidase
VDDLVPGARTAIVQCLGVQPRDRVLIFSDRATQAIGEALAQVAREQGATTALILLEDVGPRPLTEVPAALLERISHFSPTVSLFAAQGQPGEIRFRIPLGHTLNQVHRTRHGHMIGISPELMKTGMRVDYERVAALTRCVHEAVRGAREIRVRNPDGTDLVARFEPERVRWVPWTGLYHQRGDWGNLPEGETFTAPQTADGILTARLLGDHFSKRYGLLAEPVVLTLERGHVREVRHPDPELASEFWAHLLSARNGTRMGEFALGTNTGLRELTGNLLQDEKYPGVHCAFGDPYGHFTGADWSSDIHVDVIPFGVDVRVDDEPIMEQGRYVICG